MGQNYGYETLMTELPTYMKQVLRFSIKEVSLFPLSFLICSLFFVRHFTKSISLSIERNIISPSIFGDVAILNVHFGSC